MVSQQNPRRPGPGRGKKSVSPERHFPRRDLARFRRAHELLSDAEFEKTLADFEAKDEIVTREALKAICTAIRREQKAKAQAEQLAEAKREAAEAEEQARVKRDRPDGGRQQVAAHVALEDLLHSVSIVTLPLFLSGGCHYYSYNSATITRRVTMPRRMANV